MWLKCTFGDQKGLIRNTNMPFGNPPYHGTKELRIFKNIDFFTFYGSKRGIFGSENGVFECFGPGGR